MKVLRVALLAVVALLIVSFAAQQAVPEASAAAPLCLTTGGCLGFPDADATSGRFINVTRGLSSLGDLGATDNIFNVEMRVASTGATASDFELAIFDGDLSKPWDVIPRKGAPDPITFKLYPDPLVNGNSSGTPLFEWPAKYMVNDGWCVLDSTYPGEPSSDVCTDGARIPHDAGALAVDGNYYYHLVASWETTLTTNEQNNFKVVVEGEPFILPQSTIGFMGYVPGDPLGGTSTYDGTWSFRFLVPEIATDIELWDGDTDRKDDTDDFNSPNKPYWSPYSSATRMQTARPGRPMDDITGPLGIPPNVFYSIKPPVDSGETWEIFNGEPGDLVDQPSGDKEWEVYKVGLDSGPAPDHSDPTTPDETVPALPKGLYQWNFFGLDGRNTMFIYSNYATFPGLAQLGNTVWYDADQDGVWAQTPEEPGIGGVKVNLYADKGTIGTYEPGTDTYLDSRITDPTGFYIFLGLDSLDYIVEVDQSNFDPGGPLEGYFQTTTYGQGTQDDHHNRLSPWAAMIPTNKYYTLADFGYFYEEEEPGVCLVIIDEDGIDNDMRTIEKAAAAHGIIPDELTNDQGDRTDPLFGNVELPVEEGNPFFTWNEIGAGDVVKLPTGQRDDEGWFALPEAVRYMDGAVNWPSSSFNPIMSFTGFDGSTVTSITNSQEWLAGYGWGVIPQDKLDKILDVMPLRNQDLAALVGQTCTAVVYDSDISMNFDDPEYNGGIKNKGVNANLQGARLGLFSFTVLAVEVPGNVYGTCVSDSTVVNSETLSVSGQWPCELPESMSSTSLYDVWLRIEEPTRPTESHAVQPRDHEPDSIEIDRARQRYPSLQVIGSGDTPNQYNCTYLANLADYPAAYAVDPYTNRACMTGSVDGADLGGDPDVDPIVFEELMSYSDGRWHFNEDIAEVLRYRRVLISTDEGGSYNRRIR